MQRRSPVKDEAGVLCDRIPRRVDVVKDIAFCAARALQHTMDRLGDPPGLLCCLVGLLIWRMPSLLHGQGRVAPDTPLVNDVTYFDME